ncbi:hypothetical protein FRC06_005474, partial [Ceratobasidium sp. 370]
MRWMQRKVGKKTVDERYMSMPQAQGLHHFKRGISQVKQWTGREAKEMMKTCIPLVAEDWSINNDLAGFIRALVNFSYIAHAAWLTETELEELQDAHAEMHGLKHGLVSSGLGRLDKIPKWHMISHYADLIRELGMPDGYNMEGPEYLRIVYVKRRWEVSNKREGIQQIIKYCQWLEALRIHQAHLDEFYELQERRCKLTKTAVFMDDDGNYNPEAGDEGGGEPWEDIEPELGDNNEDEEDSEEEGRRRATTPEVHEVEHPAPEFAIAIRPMTRATLAKLGDIYSTTSLER